MNFARSIPKFILWFCLRSLILLGFLFRVSNAWSLPKITLPYQDSLEKSLLPPEVRRWIQIDCFGNGWNKMVEAENYQLNSYFLGAWIKIILTQALRFWRDFWWPQCNVPSWKSDFQISSLIYNLSNSNQQRVINAFIFWGRWLDYLCKVLLLWGLDKIIRLEETKINLIAYDDRQHLA